MMWQAKANDATSRSNDFRTRSQTLMLAAQNEREACFSKNAVVQKNFDAQKSEVEKHNGAVAKAKKDIAVGKLDCSNPYFIHPDRPESCHSGS